jgi:hypothetical protein
MLGLPKLALEVGASIASGDYSAFNRRITSEFQSRFNRTPTVGELYICQWNWCRQNLPTYSDEE